MLVEIIIGAAQHVTVGLIFNTFAAKCLKIAISTFSLAPKGIVSHSM